MNNTTSRIYSFLTKFPQFLPTTQTLDENNIPWMISGSGCLYLLGNERVPDDVDFFLPNDRHDEADALFGITSYRYTSPTENVRNSNPEGDHGMQLTSDLHITIEERTFDLSISPEVLEQRIEISHEGRTLWLMPPEDVLLVKAILQRGEDVGKHDIEDIQKFCKIHEIDNEYLQKRISALHASDRVGNIFK